MRGVDREYKKRGTSTDEQPPAARTCGTKRAAPTVWTAELGPCRNEDSAGKCGGKHLHKDCPKRASANAAAAAKKAVAGAQAYVAELHNDEDDSIVFIEIPAGDPLPAKTAPVPVVAATTSSTAAVVVDYIGIALQFSAFVIVLAVLSPALMPQPPATDLTAWISSAIAIGTIGVSFFVLCVRRVSFFVRGLDCVAFFVV
jgi:hypothetical protein